MIIKSFLISDLPVIPSIKLGLVDVRDVAEAHIKALNLDPKICNRIIISCTGLWFDDICNILRKNFSNISGVRVPS
jgi:nucleoside-diphosphate-sugar epimerase